VLIRNWRPWEQSVGPKTAAGKAKSAENAYKHGLRSMEWREEEKRMNAVIRRAKDTLFEMTGAPAWPLFVA